MKTYISTLLIMLSATILNAQDMYSVGNGEVLIDGYDPVSYFDGNPQKGKSEIYVSIEGRKVLFASEENKKEFINNQEKYFPEYGGWCAIAMVDGSFVIPDYSLYKIQDGRLLFFSVRAFFNGLTEWEKNPKSNLVKADGNYMKYFPGEKQ